MCLAEPVVGDQHCQHVGVCVPDLSCCSLHALSPSLACIPETYEIGLLLPITLSYVHHLILTPSGHPQFSGLLITLPLNPTPLGIHPSIHPPTSIEAYHGANTVA